jgi:hypothetical protein
MAGRAPLLPEPRDRSAITQPAEGAPPGNPGHSPERPWPRSVRSSGGSDEDRHRSGRDLRPTAEGEVRRPTALLRRATCARSPRSRRKIRPQNRCRVPRRSIYIGRPRGYPRADPWIAVATVAVPPHGAARGWFARIRVGSDRVERRAKITAGALGWQHHEGPAGEERTAVHGRGAAVDVACGPLPLRVSSGPSSWSRSSEQCYPPRRHHRS